ncbi:MAG: hypothetical protein HY611_01105, partial [Elusimicrobia bacterium]|nr:hypothetical protein [Elusimicrobiota bacterium]
MKKKWLLAIAATCLLWRPAAGLAKDLTKADGLFDKGLYQEALHQYEAALKDPAAEIRLKALYRAVESRALLFRYADAAKLAFGAQLPSDLRWKSRFLILRAEIAREFLKQYGSASPKDVEEGNKDLSRRTPEEWRGEARSAYRQLRDLRRKLIKIPLREEGYFVDLRDAEVEAIPTLWDFAALRWSEFLLDEEESPAPIKPAALSFLDENYTVKLSSEDGPAAQAAALFEDASALGGDGRSSAQEVWKITRLKIPFDHPGLVTTAPDEEGFANAAIKRLMGWFDAFSTPLGRAEAGLFAAKLLTKNSRFSDALGLCQKVETNASMLSAAKHCANLRAQFELPVLSLSAKFVPPGSRDALRVRTRNLDEVFFRLYRANP